MINYKWECLTLDGGFVGRDGAALVSFKGCLYMLGGYNSNRKDLYGNANTNNEVYRSGDGLKWTLICLAAPWTPRHTFGCVVFKDMIWVVGGDANSGVCSTDVWNSSDGINWTKVSESTPWAPRVLHQTFVHDDKIWVLGGQSPSVIIKDVADKFYNDVWRTSDGVNWECVCEYAPWFERGMIGNNAVLNGKLWLIGGGTYDTPDKPYRKFYTDVWSSFNGAEWELVTADAGWPVRQYHDVAAFDGKLWVLEGYGADEYGSRTVPVSQMLKTYLNRKDVWYSDNGKDWCELKDTPWVPRHASSVCVHDGALWVVSGNNFTADVWRLIRYDNEKHN